jgi:hypothetical protein
MKINRSEDPEKNYTDALAFGARLIIVSPE